MIVVIVAATFICLALLYFLKLNRGQEIKRLVYEHKFIPVVLGKYVNKL
ncbi:ORF53 similar to AcMNPV ORF110 [Cydia pomonella granulovirus]|uniref:ORF53 n=2 Tax=Cydia pomonella granulosis virus TaxID=28289 RepID=A0A097P1F8_GVCP|nr:ORF53 similar to AcMNPV ORF110 [Cydia pomonella granulovirus]AAK70713.1 ORF53 similar to AcMNPV ORF110 [Cydia pomonella granulovirus]AIU36699.1 ORF53 [Cydia pomonella granulovirus]AIU36842.1 ORF53 [Cydia pomonella granulovirus]AIU36978.1 ORF53 [Cydia pomonella granulovirus]AIU37120.1 ORF53 [Cydia pomonella granulovirus]